MSLEPLGRILIIAGIIIVSLGVILMFAGKVSFLGRLPGDIYIQRGNFTIYFPVVTMLLLSLLLSIIVNIIFRH